LSDLGEDFAPLINQDSEFFPLVIDTREAQELLKPVEQSSFRSMIDAQITYRDYRYIDQADAMAAYRPRLGGHESRGVAAEKTYAGGVGATPVVEYSPPVDTADLGSRPFSTDLPGPLGVTLDDFYELLRTSAADAANRRYRARQDDYAKFEEFRARHSPPGPGGAGDSSPGA